MKRLLHLLLLIILPYSLSAQYNISGKIIDSDSQPIVGASVLVNNTYIGVASGTDGSYTLKNLKEGTYEIVVSFTGFEKAIKTITLSADETLDFTLQENNLLLDNVLVKGTRATKNTATTYTNVSKEEIENLNVGQDLPYILRQAPSVLVTSDAGAGIGYTGIRVRGTDPTRVNVTINGIPVNDSESHGVFWVNMPDFASSVENIQLQRGVGTSTNGAGAFGASLNLQTTDLKKDAYGELNGTVGSFNTWKRNVQFGSGLINGKFTVDGRLSRITSDGFIDRATSDLNSYFLSAAYYDKKNILRANVFSGHEITYQAWDAIPQDILESGNRTYNGFTYDNQVDNYQQDHYQLHYSRKLTKNFTFNTALFLTQGEGFFEQFKDGEELADYGLVNETVADTAGNLLTSTDLIRRKWLDNDFYGATYGFNFNKGKLDATLGGAWAKYDGDHFGEVIWAGFAADGQIRHRYYDNNGTKTDFNTYLKATYQVNNKLGVFGDLQYRQINYEVKGIDEDKGEINATHDYQFFNPKVGVNYDINPKNNVYASFSVANREPTRSNLVDNDVLPTSERLNNLEVGYRFNSKNVSLGANYYLMDYKDQLVATGNLNNVGSPIQQNVADSYRTGIELVGGVRLFDQLRWEANATFSQNKIKEFTQNTVIFDDNFNVLGDTSITFTDTDISLSPSVIAASTLTYEPVKNLEFALLSKYVGEQFIDNTSSEDRKLDAYFTNSVRLEYAFKTPIFKEVAVNFLVNNILDVDYESNAWTYFLVFDREGQRVQDSYNNFYPQAGINFLAGLKIRF